MLLSRNIRPPSWPLGNCSEMAREQNMVQNANVCKTLNAE